MALTIGAKLGPYEILSSIGSGGMGEVYRAKDTRLGRKVAIKVLPAHLSDQPELRERFEREARVISSLNHPNICILYDIGRQENLDFLIMEYLEGQTLAERLNDGPLPLDGAISLAIEVADALDKAHKQGITHRDLKPGNIMLTKSGAKLLDFGLAKLKQDASSSGGVSSVPTKASITAQGTILGTLQYMAPEQLGGEETDARTDIFAFGATLYEAVTGKAAFESKNQASLIAAIMTADPPPMSVLQPITPSGLDHIIRVCLAKNPDERWQSARDLVRELKWVEVNSAETSLPVKAAILPTSRVLPWKIGTITFAVVALVVSVFTTIALLRPTPVRVVRFRVSPPENSTLRTLEDDNSSSISPNGTQLAFVATDSSGKTLIWVRSFDSLSARALVGTEGAQFPFWSPDSRLIGFFAQGKLKKIDASGGPAQSICDVPAVPRGGSWNNGGVILFGTNASPILRVSSEGGQPAPVTKVDQAKKQGSHRWPYFLPDNRHFLYWANGPNRAIYAGSIDSDVVKLIAPSDTNGVYATPGFLLFNREGILMQQRFDPARLELAGEATALPDRVMADRIIGLSVFSVSTNGVLTFQVLPSDVTQFAWFDRQGRLIETIGPRGVSLDHALSFDETRLAFTAAGQDRATDVWLLDIRKQSPSRLTFGGREWGPVWSPDGSNVFYTSRGGAIVQKNSSGAGAEQIVLPGTSTTYVGNLSPDGKFLVFSRFGATDFDVFVLPLIGERKPIPIAQTRFREGDPQFSPDGKWIAYDSNESGQREVYVQPFPTSGSKWQISNGGGTQPMWRRDGKELFFMSEDRKLYTTDIRSSSTFEFDIPHPLFDMRGKGYVPSRDGQRFLVNMTSDAASSSINVVLNWSADLLQKK